MCVPPPFTPLGQKAGEGARTKASLTVTSQEESLMETDAPTATGVPVRHPVSLSRPAKAKEPNKPILVDDTGMRKSSSDMLKGQPDSHAKTWEPWGNSLPTSSRELSLPRPAKAKEPNKPILVDDTGIRKWSSDMLKGQPGSHATTWEQWGNSFTNEFKGVVDTMARTQTWVLA